MTSFSYESLWAKSKVFVDRALRARDKGDSFEFYIWAAVALELLGKAALARIHPSLVADPTHFPSLLVSAGGPPTSASLKSITAKTLYDRLHTTIKGFDEPMKREALLMAERRNGELHSGDAPTHGLDPRRWAVAYWKATDVILKAQGRTLTDWLGEAEGARIGVVLGDAAELGRQAVDARIARRRVEYDAAYPPGSTEREGALSRAEARPLPSRYYQLGDSHLEAPCPACGSKAWLFGYRFHEEVIGFEEPDEDGFGGAEIVEQSYSVEEFKCPECGLSLEGVDEMAYAELPYHFEEQDFREPDYEPEYGNE